MHACHANKHGIGQKEVTSEPHRVTKADESDVDFLMTFKFEF